MNYMEELEALTGTVYRGDITPVVFELLKNTHDMKGLLSFLNKEITEVKEEQIVQPTPCLSLEEVFGNCPTVNRR